MTKDQIRHHLEQMKEYLKAMREDKEEAQAFHKEDSDFMINLDFDILMASQTIKDLTNQLNR